jgi:outer membrane protein TolC
VILALVAALLADGLTLRELQERARKNDPRVMQIAAQLESAKGKSDEAYWAFFPEFKTTGYFAGPTNEYRLDYSNPNAFHNPTDPDSLTPGSKSTGGLFHGELGVQGHIDVQGILPIWTFGKLTSGRKAAQHLVGATEQLVQRARDQAAFDVARAYWGYQTTRAAETSVQKIRDRLKGAQEMAKKLLVQQSEQISKADALKIDYLAEEIETGLASTLKNRELAITGLRLLVGVQPGEELPIAEQKLPDAPMVPSLDQVLRTALDRRPEIRAAGEAVSAREALVDLARARLWPDIGLVGGFAFTGTSNASNPPSPFVNNPFHVASGYVALGLQGTFDIPQKLARLRQAEADLHEAQAVQAGAQQLVRLDIQQAIGDLGEARIKVDRYTREADIGRQLATQAGVAFDSGLGEARELLEDTLLFARADGARLEALFTAQMAWAALEKAAGGPLQ